MRIYELAKELGIENSRDIVNFLSTADVEYKASSGLTEEEAERVREKFGKKKGTDRKVADNEKNPEKKPEQREENKTQQAKAADDKQKKTRTFFHFDFRQSGNANHSGAFTGGRQAGGRKSSDRSGIRKNGGAKPAARRPITAKQRAAMEEEQERTAPVKEARELTQEEMLEQIRNRNAKAAALNQESEPAVKETKPAADKTAAEHTKVQEAAKKPQEQQAREPEREAASAPEKSEPAAEKAPQRQEEQHHKEAEPAAEAHREQERTARPEKEKAKQQAAKEVKSEAAPTGKPSDDLKVGQNVFAQMRELQKARQSSRSTGSDRRNSGDRNGSYRRNGSQGQGGYSRGGNDRNGQGNRDRSTYSGGYSRNGQGSSQGGYRGRQGGFRGNDRQEGGYNKDRAAQGRSFGAGSRPGAAKKMSGEGGFAASARPEAKNYSRRRENHKKEEILDDEKENLTVLAKQSHKKQQKKKEEDSIRTITVPASVSLSDFADMLKVPAAELVKKLFLSGKAVTINDEIDYDTAEQLALEYNCLCEKEVVKDPIEELLKEPEEDPKDLVPRPPVVCVMGHVDHGKTSLLDYIRKSHVTEKESGGITQAIGAYTVKTKSNRQITFLDTPGHEAFTAMRMRGAQATDIAVLVVAADDGVMPQTIEAINHAKAANVTIIVAVNKIDKPNANVEKVKQELVEYGLVATDWGGDTEFCPVSAKTGEGVDDLLETIMLTADILDLRANPDRDARGIVIEAQLSKGRGPVATVLVQKGTLHVGDFAAAGEHYGRVRAMTNDKNKRVREAGPSVPVEIQGLNGVPNAGEVLKAFDTEREARSFSETFITQGKKQLVEESKKRVSLEDLFSQIKAGKVKELNLIVKADVQGSVEAVKQSLLKLSNDEVVVKVIHAGVGNINESDVILASASNAIIIGFNVKPENQAKTAADEENVDIRLYTVIYNAIEDVQDALKGMLEPIYEEKIMGHAEIRQIFKASGVGNIAGALVTDGRITAKSTARVFRGKDKIFEGKIASLKRFKDEAKEVKAGLECGIVFENFGGFAEGDTVEASEMVEVPRK
jgi:translation initiation factor IF-2